MAEVFDCRFQIGEDGPIESAHAEIPDSEWAVVEEFLHHAEALFDTQAMNIRASYRLHWKQGMGFEFSGDLPHDDQLAIVLHRMRPFILQNESTYLTKVAGVLSRYIDHAGFRGMMKGIVDEFMGKSFQQQMKVDVGGVTLNTDKMVNNWLNACEYHHAEDAKQELEQFKAVLPEQWQRALFISMLIDKASQVGNTMRIVRWLKRRDGEAFLVRT